MQKIRTEPWHEHKERRWGSAFDFRKKILRFIERFEALCQHPAPGDPELHPFANVPQSTKDVILTCLTQWRASLFSRHSTPTRGARRILLACVFMWLSYIDQLIGT